MGKIEKEIAIIRETSVELFIRIESLERYLGVEYRQISEGHCHHERDEHKKKREFWKEINEKFDNIMEKLDKIKSS